MEWRVVIEQDKKTGDWAIWCPELPGCVSAGRSQEEAEANIREAIRLYLDPMPLNLQEGAVLKSVAIQ